MYEMYFIVGESDIASYADDNTSCFGGAATENVMLNLEKLSKNLFQLFYHNQLKGNPDKCHILLSTSQKVNMNVQDFSITNTKSEKLLGMTIHFIFL